MNLSKLLIVEDDREIAQLIKTALEKEGYEVDHAEDGVIAWEKINHIHYDLILLDLMLPRMDGWEVLRRIRQEKNLPVLILSARTEETDQILGLGLGADDFITKPFRVGELIARVKSQLRRYLYLNSSIEEKETNTLIHQDLHLNRETYEVKVKGNIVPLTSKEFRILQLFMEYPNRVFSKAQIFNHVWEDDFYADENTVMVHIRRLRSKIEADSSNPVYIQTVWGIGYRLGKEGTS